MAQSSMDSEEDSPDCHHDYYTIPDSVYYEEIRPRAFTVPSILRSPILVEDELIPRPKLAWMANRKVTFGE